MIEGTIRNREPKEEPISWEEMYKNAEKQIYQLEKELKTCEAIEEKLEDRIDGLEQIITILTKIYL